MIDPTFSFMTVDHDGKIRMDCSSPYAMARLVGLKDQYHVAFANDPDCGPARHRHAVGRADEPQSLPRRGDPLPADAPARLAGDARGRQDAGQQQHDRSRRAQARPPSSAKCRSASSGSCRGCSTARCCFGGEESAGASFLRRDGTVWTTDKDGPIMDLLAAEITARTGKDPGEHYRELTAEFGTPYYTRIDAPATPEQKSTARKAVARGRHGIEPGRRADHRQADPRPGQRRTDRRAEGRRPRTAGSRRGPPAPRTSTRSTRRASAARPISTPSSARRRRSWIAPSKRLDRARAHSPR